MAVYENSKQYGYSKLSYKQTMLKKLSCLGMCIPWLFASFWKQNSIFELWAQNFEDPSRKLGIIIRNDCRKCILCQSRYMYYSFFQHLQSILLSHLIVTCYTSSNIRYTGASLSDFSSIICGIAFGSDHITGELEWLESIEVDYGTWSARKGYLANALGPTSVIIPVEISRTLFL